MREILFQDLKGINRKRRLLSLQEAFEQDGYNYTAERKIIFRVKELHSFKDGQVANKWILKRIKDFDEPKRLSLLKVCDKEANQSLWHSKQVGRFYIMRQNFVLTVAFLQSFKVTIKPAGFIA